MYLKKKTHPPLVNFFDFEKFQPHGELNKASFFNNCVRTLPHRHIDSLF